VLERVNAWLGGSVDEAPAGRHGQPQQGQNGAPPNHAGSASAGNRHARRQVQGQRSRTVDRAGPRILALHDRIFHPYDRGRRKCVKGRLVAAAQLCGPPEEVPLDQTVGRLARAALLGTWHLRFVQHVAGQLVLVRIPVAREIGDEQQDNDQPAEKRQDGRVELAHGPINAPFGLRLH